MISIEFYGFGELEFTQLCKEIQAEFSKDKSGRDYGISHKFIPGKNIDCSAKPIKTIRVLASEDEERIFAGQVLFSLKADIEFDIEIGYLERYIAHEEKTALDRFVNKKPPKLSH